MSNKEKKGVISRVPSTSWLILITLWCCYAFNGGCREIMNKVLPTMAADLALDAATTGLISTVGTVGAGILAIFLGRWADKRGQGYKRRNTQLIVWTVYLVLTLFFGIPMLTQSVTIMFIFQFIRFGFAGGGEIIDMSTGSEWWPKEAKGFIFSAIHTGYPWGTAILSVLISFLLTSTGDWRTPFLVIPLIAIVPTVIYSLVATKNRFAKAQQQMIERGLTPSVTMDMVEHSGKDAVEEGPKEKVSGFGLLKNPNVLACVICYVCIVGAYFGFNYWLTPYITYVCGYDNSAAVVFSSLFAITAGVGQIFWGTFSDKIGCKRTIMICAAWLFVCFLLLPQIQRGIGFLIAIQLLMGFCTNASFPVINNFCGRSVKPNQLATTLGLCAGSMIIGGFVPYLIGIFISAGGGFYSIDGYNLSLTFMCGCLVVGFLVILLLSHEVTGPRRGKDWALTSYKACGIEDNRNK